MIVATVLALAIVLVPVGTSAQVAPPTWLSNPPPPASRSFQREHRFVTVAPEPRNHAWYLRAEFHPFHKEIRGIPVQQIDKAWCKAREFSKDLIPSEFLVVDGNDVMALSGLSFAVEGYFDKTQIKQTALVGVYESCDGEKGAFLLILDEPRNGSRKIRHLSADATQQPFSALAILPDLSILVMFCMDCDFSARLQWSQSEGRFLWLKEDTE